VGAIDTAALEIGPRSRTRKKVFSILVCEFSGRYSFGKKIIKTVATRCHIFKAEMHQIRFRLGLRPRPRSGAYSDPTDPLAGFKGAHTSKGKERRGKREGGKERA